MGGFSLAGDDFAGRFDDSFPAFASSSFFSFFFFEAEISISNNNNKGRLIKKQRFQQPAANRTLNFVVLISPESNLNSWHVFVMFFLPGQVPLPPSASSPSRGWECCGCNVFYINQPSLPTSFFKKFYSGVYFHVPCPFNCITLHKFSRQLSAFSLRSYFCLTGPFNCISFDESLLQP